MKSKDITRVKIAESFIKQYFRKTKTIRDDYSSYGLKHIVERNQRLYISNEDFIEAMLNCSYKAKPIPNSKNYYFNISLRSINQVRNIL